MAKKMTKAQMEAFKKKNFDKTKKVSKDQLDKLRKEGTPEKAIAKYKNDPAMREALNRFYGKDRVSKVAGSASTSGASTSGAVRGGPGAKMPKRPAGGPGAKMTNRDGRGAGSSTAVPTASKSGSKSNAKKVDDAVRWVHKNVGPDKVLALTGVGSALKAVKVAGAVAKGKTIAVKQGAAQEVAKRATAKANEAIKLQKAATAAKNAAKTGKGSGVGSASRAAKLQREAAAAKKAADALAQQARNANARTKSMGTPPSVKTTPKSKTASAKAATSGTAKQADEMLMRIGKLPRKYKKTTAATATAAYLARPKKDEK